MKKLFIDLFCGSSSFKKEAEAAGFEYYGIDWDNYEHVTVRKDIEFLTLMDLPDLSKYDRVHLHGSPDCKTYTIAAISKHRNGVEPKSEYAFKCDNVNKNVVSIINHLIQVCKQFTFDLENPRGMMRKMPFMQTFTRHTVWYCKYGDDRAKPTDIWTNLNWISRPVCHNGNLKCHHQPAPRGSKTGTQGRKDSYERSRIPNELCKELIEAISNTSHEFAINNRVREKVRYIQTSLFEYGKAI